MTMIMFHEVLCKTSYSITQHDVSIILFLIHQLLVQWYAGRLDSGKVEVQESVDGQNLTEPEV